MNPLLLLAVNLGLKIGQMIIKCPCWSTRWPLQSKFEVVFRRKADFMLCYFHFCLPDFKFPLTKMANSGPRMNWTNEIHNWETHTPPLHSVICRRRMDTRTFHGKGVFKLLCMRIEKIKLFDVLAQLNRISLNSPCSTLRWFIIMLIL